MRGDIWDYFTHRC